jgi:hypothetical protein
MPDQRREMRARQASGDQQWQAAAVRSLRLAQRIVLVIALALALGVLGRYLVTLQRPSEFGWFAYAPLNSTISAPHPPGLHPWARLLIWLGLIAVWALASLLLLRPARQGDPKRL